MILYQLIMVKTNKKTNTVSKSSTKNTVTQKKKNNTAKKQNSKVDNKKNTKNVEKVEPTEVNAEEEIVQQKKESLQDFLGLTFSIRQVKTSIISWYETKGYSSPKFCKGHIMITAVVEELYKIICERAIKSINRDQTNLYNISANALNSCLTNDSGLKRFFAREFEFFNKNSVYSFPPNNNFKSIDTSQDCTLT